MFRSIQWRTAFVFSLLPVLVTAVLGVYLTYHVREIQLEGLRFNLQNQANIISGLSIPALSGNSQNADLKTEINKINLPVDERITVINGEGVVIVDTEKYPGDMENHAVRPEFREALSGRNGESARFSTTLGYEMLYVAVPVIENDRILGAVRVSTPLNKIENVTGSVTWSIVLAALVSVTAAVVAAWLLVRPFFRTVKEVTEAARKMESGELKQRVGTGGIDETGRLARNFNRMSARLAERIETLAEDRTRLAGILDNIADGVIMTSRQGTVLMANRAVMNIFRIEDGDTTGKPVIEVLHEPEIDRIIALCAHTRREQVTQFESDHHRRFLRVLAVPVKGDNHDEIIVLIQDLTELRTLQTMRRELIGNISHDFRTPLAGIKAMADTLIDGAIDDKEAAVNFLTRIEGEVDRLTQMVAELTELSRIETGRAELRLETVNLDELVAEAAARLKPQADRKSIEINIESDSGLPEVLADKERLRQVFINLLHNAVKFTGEGGRIDIKSVSGNNRVTIEITDNGIGISARDLPHIFERFYMADRSRSGGGTGLGLAIARHVVEAHNGTIRARSREGKGSTFTISLRV